MRAGEEHARRWAESGERRADRPSVFTGDIKSTGHCSHAQHRRWEERTPNIQHAVVASTIYRKNP
jgi:hypothetical protein